MLPSWLSSILADLAPIVDVTALVMVGALGRRVHRIETHLGITPGGPSSPSSPSSPHEPAHGVH